MSFASILQTLQARILAPSTAEYYTLKSIQAPTEVIPWENNPLQWDESDYTQPPRPYLGVEWGDIPLRQGEGQLAGMGEFVVKVVLDNFHQGRNSSEDKADYVALLSYADTIADLLVNHAGIEVIGMQRPLFAVKKNIVIIGIRCRIETRRQIGRVAWKPTPAPDPEP